MVTLAIAADLLHLKPAITELVHMMTTAKMWFPMDSLEVCAFMLPRTPLNHKGAPCGRSKKTAGARHTYCQHRFVGVTSGPADASEAQHVQPYTIQVQPKLSSADEAHPQKGPEPTYVGGKPQWEAGPCCPTHHRAARVFRLCSSVIWSSGLEILTQLRSPTGL